VTRKTLKRTILIFGFIALLWPLGAVSHAVAPSAEFQNALQSGAVDELIPVIATLKDEVNPALFTSADKNVHRRWNGKAPAIITSLGCLGCCNDRLRLESTREVGFYFCQPFLDL